MAPSTSPLTAFVASLNIGIWLYSGMEKLTPNAGEVKNPSRAFPIAIALGLLMSAGSYLIPTCAALASHGHWSEWGESYFSVAAQGLGGPILGGAMAAGALLSSIGLLMVTMLGQSRLPMVMAEDGLFPRAFARTHPRHGTPTVSLLFGGVVLSVLVLGKFSSLVAMFSLVQVTAYLLLFAALLQLRWRESRRDASVEVKPNVGFRIPMGISGLVLLSVPCLLLSSMVIIKSVWHKGVVDVQQALIDALVLASGPLSYFLLTQWRRRLARG